MVPTGSGAEATVASTPPAAPEQVGPTPAHAFRLADPQRFTLRTTDPDGDPWVGVIEVRNLGSGRVASFLTPPAPSGDFSGIVAVPPLPAGSYEWRARAVDATGLTGPWSGISTFTVGTNRTPGTPVLLEPEDGATLRRLGNAPFQISAVDADGDVFRGVIVIRNAANEAVAEIPTIPSASGGVSSGVLTGSLAEGLYRWSARVTDVYDSTSESSPTRMFTVGPPPTGGGGAFLGTISYTPTLPSATGVCESSSAALHLESSAVFVNVALVGYLGAMTIDAAMTSECASARSGSGSVTAEGSGEGPTESTIECTELSGRWTRAGPTLALTLSGACSINHFPLSRVAFDFAFEAVTSGFGAGLIERVQTETVSGVVAVRPD